MNHQPVGIFDSGFGGLTVMKAIRELLPHENIVYFGDTARLPYGTKSRETILRYSLENASFLMNQGIKALVVACHTACSFAFEELQKRLPIPVIGVTIPAVEHALSLSRSGQIGVLGTKGTIASGTYQQLLQKIAPKTEVSGIACQLLVHLVEEGFIDHAITQNAIEQYLSPLQKSSVDTVILGCTHFPLLEMQIKKALNPDVQVIDPAHYCARSLKQTLQDCSLLNPQTTLPHYQFFVSDDPEKFRLMGKAFLGYPLENVQLVSLISTN